MVLRDRSGRYCDDKVTVATPDFDGTPKNRQTTYTVDKADVPEFDDISKVRNRKDKNIQFLTDTDKDLQDFYYRYDRGEEKVDTAKKYTISSDPMEKASAKDISKLKDITAYQLDFVNKGGLVMPIILEFTFEDGSKLNDKIGVQIWRQNEQKVSRTYYFDKRLKSVQLDPMLETADIDTSNNYWSAGGSAVSSSKFQVFKAKEAKNVRGGANGKINPMQAAEKK